MNRNQRLTRRRVQQQVQTNKEMNNVRPQAPQRLPSGGMRMNGSSGVRHVVNQNVNKIGVRNIEDLKKLF